MINWIDLILILFNFIFFIGVQTIFVIIVAKTTTKTQLDIIIKKTKILLGPTLEKKISPYLQNNNNNNNNNNNKISEDDIWYGFFLKQIFNRTKKLEKNENQKIFDSHLNNIDNIYKKWKNISLEDKKKIKIELEKNNNSNASNYNKNLLIKFILIPVCILVGIIIILFFLSKKYKNKWEPYHFKSLCLIFFGYLTEILVYLMLIKQYKPINLSQILENAVLKIEKIIYGRNIPTDENIDTIQNYYNLYNKNYLIKSFIKYFFN